MASLTVLTHSVETIPSDPTKIKMTAHAEGSFSTSEIISGDLYYIFCWIYEDIHTNSFVLVFSKDLNSSTLILFLPPSSAILQMKKPLVLRFPPDPSGAFSKDLEIVVNIDHVDVNSAMFRCVGTVYGQSHPAYNFGASLPISNP
ncbi:MAG: hypothetical protein R3D45_13715 [Rhizobiaceae bacterium]